MEVNGERHAPAALLLEIRPDNNITGDMMSPMAGRLDGCGKSRPHRSPDRLAWSESLCRLSYRAPQ